MIGRYVRQRVLGALSPEQEELLHGAAVCCVGCGGVASSLLEFLAGAGVATLGLIDSDIVAIENLHRQVVHSE